jgi:hypothetical protein
MAGIYIMSHLCRLPYHCAASHELVQVGLQRLTYRPGVCLSLFHSPRHCGVHGSCVIIRLPLLIAIQAQPWDVGPIGMVIVLVLVFAARDQNNDSDGGCQVVSHAFLWS